MTAARPAVFIGSSSERLDVAKKLQVLLDHAAECEVWSQGVFGLGSLTLESLAAARHKFDFAVLVLDVDDTAVSRGDAKSIPRDNVIFELGLFMGALGHDRTFIVYDRSRPPDLPSDLAGVTAATYQRHASGITQGALGAAATRIEEEMRRLGRRTAVPADVDPSEPKISELIQMRQRYTLSVDSPKHLDMEYYRRQKIRCNAPDRLKSHALIWTRTSDALPPFDASKPTIKLRLPERSGAGTAYLADEPRKNNASAFALDLKFDPPLLLGETIDFMIDGMFRNYRFSRAEDLRAATRDTPMGQRDFDFLSWTVNHPTHELDFIVDLPSDAGIIALGPRSNRSTDDFPIANGPNAALNEEYDCTEETDGAQRFIRMQLRVHEPKLKCRYRLAWRLP
ncbi:TIR domain-containing protein [Mycolicibacterium porcinum]|uniref:TIR domain-containing protein n=1 Tax=Mycolicibacterium porcinum TaxID=39693 RepID=A0ABV3VRU1_9MYCO